jgi:hypothetical protein
MKKILITGTGRCGTTFLIKLFTYLGFDTGFTKQNFSKFINKNCNSGMEKDYKVNHQVIKSPFFIEMIDKIYQEIEIEYIIIPIRNYHDSAKSRVRYKDRQGGLWNAKNEEEQVKFFYKLISNYIFQMTQFNLPTLFINFEKMISDKQYLFNTLQPVLTPRNLSFEDFSISYDEAYSSSKPN